MTSIPPEHEVRRLLGPDDEPIGPGILVAVWYGVPERTEVWASGVDNPGNWYPVNRLLADPTMPHPQWKDVLARGPVVLLVPAQAEAYHRGWQLGRRELLHRLQDLIDAEPPRIEPATGPATVQGVVYGPHCIHPECGFSHCDGAKTPQEGVHHGCVEQTTCPYCGPTSDAWPRLIAEWEDWATHAYGTTDAAQLRADGRSDNVIATAELIAAHRPTEP